MRWFLLVCPLVFYSTLYAQQSIEPGLMPKINYNYSFANNLKLNGAMENRFADDFQHERMDLTVLLNKKVGFSTSLTGGYAFINRVDGVNTHRTIQQFVIKDKWSSIPISHRIATDQSFGDEQPTELRLRYRFVGQIALSGERADRKESYLKMGSELLNQFQNNLYEVEWRLTPSFGYLFNDDNKIEFAPELRVNPIFSDSSSSNLWVKFTWYMSGRASN